MDRMFQGATNFNQPLDDWDVASVNDMYRMFAFASNFNQPLDDWDVASVTNMYVMFQEATNFNQPIDDWNAASVNDMRYMFEGATNFNQCLSTWADKTPSNVSVNNIFLGSGCPDKTTDASVGPWCQGDAEQCYVPPPTIAIDCTLCTSSTVIAESDDFQAKVSNCLYNASNCPEGISIGCWNTSEVTDMYKAFDVQASFNDSINCWNTSRVTDMTGMFRDASNFNQPLDDWNVARVTTMRRMFDQATNFNQSTT